MVRVTIQNGGIFYGENRRVDAISAGTHWKITEKKRSLVILDAAGEEVARYKDGRWLDVQVVPRAG